MDIEKIQNVASVIILFLGPIIGIVLFVCAMEYPNSIILGKLDEDDIKNNKQYIRAKKIILYIASLLIFVASFLLVFSIINITYLGGIMCIILLLFTITDNYISNKYI